MAKDPRITVGEPFLNRQFALCTPPLFLEDPGRWGCPRLLLWEGAGGGSGGGGGEAFAGVELPWEPL